MGNIMATCCQDELIKTEMNTSSTLGDIFQDEELLNEIPTIKDSNEGIKYITSNKCYELLIRKIPKVIFTKTLCKNLNTSEIFIFIKKSIDYINKVKIMKNEAKIKKYILTIKNYTKYGTKNISEELDSINNLIQNRDDNYLLQSLSNWIMLIQLIFFLNNKNDKKNRGSDFSCKNECNAYDINLWCNQNLEKAFKRYSFEGCFFLIQIKMRYISNNSRNSTNQFLSTPSDIKVSNEIKNEAKNLFDLTQDFVKEISDDNNFW